MTEDKKIQHFLVPSHTKMSEEEKAKFLEKYNISLKQIPMIFITDPAIQSLGVQAGDLIHIKRYSSTVKSADYYRAVVDG